MHDVLVHPIVLKRSKSNWKQDQTRGGDGKSSYLGADHLTLEGGGGGGDFIIPGVFKKSQQYCNHSLPLLTLNSGFDDATKLFLHMCNALLVAYHKQYYKWR